MNNVHIGNYGVKDTDVESSTVKIRGLIARNLEEQFSRLLANGDLNTYLVNNNLVAIDNLDTRALVAHIREKGAMNCIISSDDLDIESLKKKLAAVPSMDGLELASTVSTQSEYELGDPGAAIKVAVLDFGVKQHILQCLVDRGAHVRVHPAKTPLSRLKEFNPSGYFISNGPGDPASMDYAIAAVKEVLEEQKPVFGICLGHQLLALANDIPTFKMHHGHRGLNHPVKNIKTGKGEITSQNHGFVISKDSIANNPAIEITHIHLNDQTVAGISIKNKPIFSVQYHPEASAGPHDSRYLFDDFITNMTQYKQK